MAPGQAQYRRSKLGRNRSIVMILTTSPETVAPTSGDTSTRAFSYITDRLWTAAGQFALSPFAAVIGKRTVLPHHHSVLVSRTAALR